jgi:DNA replication and repair protein RecF
VVALDDLASELDRHHQQRVLQRLIAYGAQIFITGTEAPASLSALDTPACVFHVKHTDSGSDVRRVD